MGSEKNSFLLHSDIESVVNKLPDDKAGKLFKIILNYVNGVESDIDDLVLQIAFEPIKNSIKRNADKWKEIAKKRSASGRSGGLKSGELRKNSTKEGEKKQTEQMLHSVKQNQANEAVSVSVSGSVSENHSADAELFCAFHQNYPVGESFGKRKSVTDFEYFKKTIPDWREVLPMLAPALAAQLVERQAKVAAGQKVFKMKHITNWLKERMWEQSISHKIEEDPYPTVEIARKNDPNFNPKDPFYIKKYNLHHI